MENTAKGVLSDVTGYEEEKDIEKIAKDHVHKNNRGYYLNSFYSGEPLQGLENMDDKDINDILDSYKSTPQTSKENTPKKSQNSKDDIN